MVSIRSKVRRRIESTEEIVLPENYNVIEAENEAETLKNKSKEKLTRMWLIVSILFYKLKGFFKKSSE